MPEPLEAARKELDTLLSIQFVVGECRFVGKEAHRATEALDYLEAKVQAAQKQLDSLSPTVEVVP